MRLVLTYSTNLLQALEITNALITSGSIDVVVDSVAALVPKASED